MNPAVELVVRFSLPRINAIVFPIIIILRKPALKKRYFATVKNSFYMPVKLTTAIWSIATETSTSTRRYSVLPDDVNQPINTSVAGDYGSAG